MKLEEVERELELQRDKLQQIYQEKGTFLNKEVIEISQKLDKLIVQLLKYKKDEG